MTAPAPALPDRSILSQLPMVVSAPALPVIRRSPPPPLTEAQRMVIIAQVSDGATVAATARALSLPFPQVRSAWANHSQQLQRHIAEAGQEECSVCRRQFVPSISHPHTCARCSRD